MFAILRLLVVLVKIVDDLLNLEAELEVEKRSRIGSRDMKNDVFPHTCLENEKKCYCM